MFDLDKEMELVGDAAVSEEENKALNELARFFKGFISTFHKESGNYDAEFGIKWDSETGIIKVVAVSEDSAPLYCRWDAKDLVELSNLINEHYEGMEDCGPYGD